MPSSVGITGSVSNAQVYALPPVANTTAAAASSPITASATATQSTAQTVYASKLVMDPLAGAITEYLNSQGNVDSQTPSATVVAYLKAGLTAQGEPKNQADNLA